MVNRTTPVIARDRRFFWCVTIIFVFLETVPYLIAWKSAGQDYVFGGFLINPQDGNSYLAKMYQGWLGEWRFKLPYTAEAGQGAYLFIYYIFLGHLARLFHLQLIFIFHAARIINTVILLCMIYRFLTAVLPANRQRRLAFILMILGSGLGWLFLPFGKFTSDFWVAEAYPFLSAYANPHFPLSLALLLWLLTPSSKKKTAWDWALFIWVGLVLSLLSPFAVVIGVVILSALAIWNWIEQRDIKYVKDEIICLIGLIVGGVPYLLYDVWVVGTDPVLRGWNAQNITPSPGIGDLIISLSPALLLSVPGIWVVLRRKYDTSRVLLVWALIGIILLYIPLGLQRRFMIGLFIPVAILAVLGIDIFVNNRIFTKLIVVGVFLLSIPTNMIIVLSGYQGAQTHNPTIYITNDEGNAFQWIASQTPRDALILAAPDTGLLIPAYTGRRVLYGHPFETINAVQNETLVIEAYQSGNMSRSTVLKDIDYIFYGPREKILTGTPGFGNLPVVYQNEGVIIYSNSLNQ